MKKTSIALGLYALCGAAHAELVDAGRFTHDYMGTASAREWVAKYARNPRLAYLNRFVNGRFTDSGILPAKDHLHVDGNEVDWHLSDTPFALSYVLVQEGYNSYHLYKVTEDERQDSKTPQHIDGQAWNAFGKDDKEIDFKGESAIGDVVFFGTLPPAPPLPIPPSGEVCCSGGGKSPKPTPKPTPRPTPSPSASPSASPTPTMPPHPTPSPSGTPHNVPDDSDTFSLFLLAAAACAFIGGWIGASRPRK